MRNPAAVRTLPARRAALLLTALLALGIPALALAATAESLVALARGTPYLMQCSLDGLWFCHADASRFHPEWFAKIAPATGQEDTLETRVVTGQLPMDATTRSWMIDMHVHACGGPKGAVDGFVNLVGNLTKTGQAGPTDIGTCTFTGELLAPGTTVPFYLVSSKFNPPPPTPSVTPTPTPSPTPTPTATPRPTPTATAAASVAPSIVPSAAPSEGPSAVPSPSGPVAPVESQDAPPSPSPVVGGEATVLPSVAPSAGPAATPAPSEPSWDSSVLAIADVNTDGGAAGGSLLLALLLLLIIGFIGELFNNTVENNYDEIAGWFRKGPIGRVRGALGRLPRINPPGRPGVLVFIALTALITSFVDPQFGLNARSIAVFLGFLIGLIVVLASFKLPPILARRRKTGELAQLRPMPWALVIATLFVLVSRLLHLQPGYLYGIVLGAIFVSDVSDRDEGRETFFGSLWTLGAALAAWIGLTWLRGLGMPPDGFGVTLLSTAFAATLVAGLEAAAFALMPMRFLPGYTIYKWNRLVWAVLWGVSLFAFVHILIGPTSGYVSELDPQAFLAALGVFAAFGAVSIGTWLYFRLRQPTVVAAAE